jgi:hypothetical protein
MEVVKNPARVLWSDLAKVLDVERRPIVTTIRAHHIVIHRMPSMADRRYRAFETADSAP